MNEEYQPLVLSPTVIKKIKERVEEKRTLELMARQAVVHGIYFNLAHILSQRLVGVADALQSLINQEALGLQSQLTPSIQEYINLFSGKGLVGKYIEEECFKNSVFGLGNPDVVTDYENMFFIPLTSIDDEVEKRTQLETEIHTLRKTLWFLNDVGNVLWMKTTLPMSRPCPIDDPNFFSEAGHYKNNNAGWSIFKYTYTGKKLVAVISNRLDHCGTGSTYDPIGLFWVYHPGELQWVSVPVNILPVQILANVRDDLKAAINVFYSDKIETEKLIGLFNKFDVLTDPDRTTRFEVNHVLGYYILRSIKKNGDAWSFTLGKINYPSSADIEITVSINEDGTVITDYPEIINWITNQPYKLNDFPTSIVFVE